MDLRKMESDRLLFLPFEDGDFEHLKGVLGNEIVCKHLPFPPLSDEYVTKFLNYFIKTFVIEKKNLHYKVLLKKDNMFIGYCGCSYIEEYQCNEIEYFLKPDYFGFGYATEIAFMMKKVAIELGFTHLVGLADTTNIPSQKILLKIGYTFNKEVEHWGMKLKLYDLYLD